MRTVLSILLFIIVISVSIVPYIIYSAIPAVSYTYPQTSLYASTVRATGTIAMDDIRQIYLTQAALTKDVLVSVGDHVEKGQLMARLDPAPEPSPFDLAQDMALNQWGIDQEELNSYVALLEQYGVDSAVLAQMLLSQETSAVATPQREAAESQDILAPISGVVTEINLKKDSLTGTGLPAITIGDDQNFLAVVSVRESDISLIRLGASAEITGSGMGTGVYTGYVSRIYPTAKKVLSGTTSATAVDVEIKINNPDEKLKHGFTAKADISTGEPREVLTIPYEVIQQDKNNVEYVYLYENARVRRQDIITGAEMADSVEVQTGLTSQDVLILDPERIPSDSAMVRLRGGERGHV